MQEPDSVYYEVFETNADLEELDVVFDGFDRDIAESVMYKKFNEAQFQKDFMLYNHQTQSVEVACFTEKTKGYRNECQG